MSYRVEVSVSGRAACAATHCKNEKIKIAKGELRCGTLVITPDFQSMKWRHWGCVTPTVLHNWWETAGKDVEMIDGFDELPAECQDKVKTALEIGHVADDEWNGDVECNRYDPKNKAQGMFLKGQRLREKQAAEAAANGEESPAKPASKKRGRAAEAADDVAEATPAKKSKAKSAKVEVADAPVTKKQKTKAVKQESDGEEATTETTKSQAKTVKKEADEDEMPPPTKKSKAKAVKPEPTEEEAASSTKKTKSKAKANKTEADEDEEPAPNKKPKSKAVKKEVHHDDEVPGSGKSKKSKTKAVDGDDDAATAAVKAKGRGKPKPAPGSDNTLEDAEPTPKTNKRKKAVKGSA